MTSRGERPVEVGDAIPPWTMESVSRARMRTVAAIFRDPNPVHWDPAFVASRGAGERVINQSPLNVGYIANMLMTWAGPSCIRRLKVEFPEAVFGDDRVTAGGRVESITQHGDERRAHCAVWLDHDDGRRAVEGLAIVAIESDRGR